MGGKKEIIMMSVFASEERPLIIRLLGSFDVQVNGRALPRLRSRKGQWLLALLVLRQGQQIARSWLAGVLWADSPERQALANLRLSLTDLRKALGSEAYRLQSSDAHTLSFNIEGGDVDVIAFDAALANGETADLQRAIILYRGALLEGCAEEWVIPERAVREAACLRALETLAAQAIRQGDPADAVDYLRKAVAADPFRESAQCALMEALVASGDHTAATLVYRAFCLLLQSELNTGPAAETTALFQRLRGLGRNMARQRPVVPKSPDPDLHSSSHSLPRPRTPLIGRVQEIHEIAACLDNHALITLTGSGGIGKTRLAIAVANVLKDEYPDGVWFADLTSVSDPGGVVNTVAALLGGQATANQRLMEAQVDHLQHKTLLLVLDNCEHLIEACVQLVEPILAGCPNVRILATSRQNLGIAGERIWRVEPLKWPASRRLPSSEKDRVSVCMDYEAIRLFVECAQAAYPAFRLTSTNCVSIMQIVWMLEGVPFAIELAAAWVRVLSAEQIAARMEDRLTMLTGGGRMRAKRQESVRATLDWSYDLLSEPERRLLCDLSVFAGGWTVEAAEAVCTCDDPSAPSVLSLLANLSDKSLVAYAEQSGQARFQLLETTREYAQSRLKADIQVDLLRRHADYYLKKAAELEAKLTLLQQGTRLRQIEMDYANLRVALDWNLNAVKQATYVSPEHIENGLQLAVALYPFWQSENSIGEGRRILADLLDSSEALQPSLRAKAYYNAGRLAFLQSSHEQAHVCFETSLSIARATDNSALEADSLCQLGIIAWDTGDYPAAEALLMSSIAIFERSDDREGLAVALSHLGIVARRQGNFIAARSLGLKSLALCKENDDRQGMAFIFKSLGMLAYLMGNNQEAWTYHEQSLALWRQLNNNWGIATALNNLGFLACEQGDYDRARSLLLDSLQLRCSQTNQHGFIETFEVFARFFAAEGQTQRATRLLGAAEMLCESIQTSLRVALVDYVGSLTAARKELSQEAFDRAWAEGRSMRLEQVIEMIQANA
jgi:predicted ATPase/DNA-binding SARP family transcriptional activator